MANATCQFTQGVIVGGSGQSVLGFSPNVLVTMTDNGGAGAISYLWEIVSWPSPLSSPPSITNSTQQVATVTPALDGTYIVKLTRVDGTGTTTDLKFFGVQDNDGLTLPSAGQTGSMTNQSLNAQKAGWAGRANASTNSQIDAYLRFLKVRAGQYVGQVDTIAHSSSSPVTVQVQEGSSKPYRVLTLTGSGLYTEELLTTPSPAQGKRFRYLVQLNPGAGGFVVKNGVGGTTLLTLDAPPTGVANVRWDVEFTSNGTAWSLARTTVIDPKAQRTFDEIYLVSGNRVADQTIETRIGAARFNRAWFPANARVNFVALIESTTGKTAAVRLYNFTDGVYVGTEMQASSENPAWVEQTVTLPATGDRDYEVFLRMTTSGGPGDRVTCTNAKLVVRWG